MIVTVTLNPALDISGSVEQLIPNEKCYVHGETRTPGGNGINAAILAQRLGARITATGFLGGPNGAEIKLLLDKQNLKHSFVPIEGHTRMNLTVSNQKDHLQTRLSFPGPEIKAGELVGLQSILNKISPTDIAIIGGSLPPNMEVGHVLKLVRGLKKRGVFCMVDLPAAPLKTVIKGGPMFIKPNLHEFQQLTGSKVESIESVLKLAQKLYPKIDLVCVSSVEGGAILIRGKEAWFGKIPKVKIKSTVGAGDSMVGAMAAMLQKDIHCPLEQLLRMGLAAACATLTEPGMVLGSRKATMDYLPKIKLRKLA